MKNPAGSSLGRVAKVKRLTQPESAAKNTPRRLLFIQRAVEKEVREL